MTRLAEIFQQYGPRYLQQYGSSIPRAHRKTMYAIQHCRTATLGHAVYRCENCATLHRIHRSCGNRHCPTCQSHKTQLWLAKQLASLLPCPYFLITFTIPQPLRRFVRSHQRLSYAAMFQAASQALKTLAADPKFLGTSRLGFVAVLHTWGRQLNYHPHIHLIVPAGGLSHDARRWSASRPNFFVPVKALSVIYRVKFREAIKQHVLHDQIDPDVWKQPWCVHSKAVGDGRNCLKYLAPYVFRVAISNHRIASCDRGQVTFRYRKSGSRRERSMTLHAFEFIRRFLQHVLPSGFMKVRHYGFLNPRSKHSINLIRRLIGFFYTVWINTAWSDLLSAPLIPRFPCPRCGKPMRLLRIVLPNRVIIVPTLDSG